jgi:hypothetical protein
MVVILAGYPDKMAGMFTKNTGLKSRFKQSLEFEDWASDELSKLIVADLRSSTPAFAIDDEAAVKTELSRGFDCIRRSDALSWANARDSNTMRELMKDAYYERAAALRAGSDADAPPPAVTGAQRVPTAPACAALTRLQLKTRKKPSGCSSSVAPLLPGAHPSLCKTPAESSRTRPARSPRTPAPRKTNTKPPPPKRANLLHAAAAAERGRMKPPLLTLTPSLASRSAK